MNWVEDVIRFLAENRTVANLSRALASITRLHRFYLEDIVPKQIQGACKRFTLSEYSTGLLLTNRPLKEWLCAINETVQSPQERSEMRKTLALIPHDLYYKSQAKRMEIGMKVRNAEDCKALCTALASRDGTNPVLRLYQTELLPMYPSSLHDALYRNLIVAWSIRSRAFL